MHANKTRRHNQTLILTLYPQFSTAQDMDTDPMKSSDEAHGDQSSDDATFENSSDSQSMDNVAIETGANETVESEPADHTTAVPDAYGDDVVVVMSTSADDADVKLVADVEVAAASADVEHKGDAVKVESVKVEDVKDVVKVEVAPGGAITVDDKAVAKAERKVDDKAVAKPERKVDGKPVVKAERKLTAMGGLTSPILLAAPMAGGSGGNAHASPSIKILYVKPLAFPRSTSNVTTSSPSFSFVTTTNTTTTTTPLTSTNIKSELFLDKLKLSHLSSIRSAEPASAASASTSHTVASESLKPVEHTVNLLNNNRIVIKSVKTATSNATSTTKAAANADAEQAKCAHDAELKLSIADNVANHSADTAASQSATDERTKRAHCADASDNGVSNHTDGDAAAAAAKFDASDSQHMFADTGADDSVAHEAKASPKIGREFKQLQKDVSESKILTEYMMDQTAYRRPVAVAKSKQARASDAAPAPAPEESGAAAAAAPAERVESPALSESDRSASSVTGLTGGKRNTRSRNTDFSAKQRRFLRNIQQLARGTDDESDNVGEDDEDDLDFHMAQERRKSVARPMVMPKVSCFFGQVLTSFGERTRRFVAFLLQWEIRLGLFCVYEFQNTWDKYCWKCHQLETTMFCSACVRSYHTSCVKTKQMTDSEMETWQCSECVELSTAEQENRRK